MQDLYFNYYSVSSLISFAATLVLTIFLLRLPKKSQATLYLGLAFFVLCLWNLAYTYAALYYHPLAAFHRWGSVFGSALVSPFLARFFLVYPENTHPRFTRIFFAIHLSTAFLVTGYFIYRTLVTPYYYHFDGHYWDFDADGLSRMVGLYLMLSNLCFWVIGFWRAWGLAGRQRWAVLAMNVTLIFCSFAQGYTNVLSRDGALPRSLFQTVYSLTIVLGFFVLAIVYINNARDRTSFMTKIVGISLTTLLTVLQGLSFFTLQDQDRAYDRLRRAQLDLYLAGDRREIPGDLVYIRELNPATGEGRIIYSREGADPGAIDFEPHGVAMLNTVLRERLRTLVLDPALDLAPAIEGAHERTAGYRAMIEDALSGLDPERTQAERLTHALDGRERDILFRFNKIRKLAGPDYRQSLYEYLEKEGRDPGFKPFADAIRDYAVSHPDLGDAALRTAAMEFLAPMRAAGTRLYRRAPADLASEAHFVAFERYDAERGVLFEAGFDYRSYRAFIGEAASRLAWMVLVILLVAVVGFQFFFQGALVSPLNTLLGGVRKVDEGILDVRVPVRVEDEIGQLTLYFNRMVDSIRDARQALQEYADGLEEKVRQRTAELQNTLEEVQSLKHQQDGDYFLTSLLMRPLSANRASSKNVNVETLVRQKKTFSFRKWEEEIGGDCCSSYNIKLNRKRYTVFLNADAMGKSMQGAGGVLVLGAVLESIVDRTLLSASARNVYPERWLKNTFIELHKVFEGFEGSMLISLVMGLVDEESGLMYYINAEHPWTVLYRDGQARFIDEDLDFRKLGTTGMEGGQIFIRTFQLEPGDVIIAGSDGRDDVLLATNDGERVLNTDEALFLRHVENGRGDLETITDEILKVGPLTDDLSLLRLAFKEDHPLEKDATSGKVTHLIERAKVALRDGRGPEAVAALEEARGLDDHNRRVIKLQVKAYLEGKEYAKAATAAEDYSYIAPSETEFLFLASFCYKKIGKLEESADFGERVRLREPDNIKNLLHLGDLYARKKNFKRARGMVADILEREPDHEKARAMLAKLDELEPRVAMTVS